MRATTNRHALTRRALRRQSHVGKGVEARRRRPREASCRRGRSARQGGMGWVPFLPSSPPEAGAGWTDARDVRRLSRAAWLVWEVETSMANSPVFLTARGLPRLTPYDPLATARSPMLNLSHLPTSEKSLACMLLTR